MEVDGYQLVQSTVSPPRRDHSRLELMLARDGERYVWRASVLTEAGKVRSRWHDVESLWVLAEMPDDVHDDRVIEVTDDVRLGPAEHPRLTSVTVTGADGSIAATVDHRHTLMYTARVYLERVLEERRGTMPG